MLQLTGLYLLLAVSRGGYYFYHITCVFKRQITNINKKKQIAIIKIVPLSAFWRPVAPSYSTTQIWVTAICKQYVVSYMRDERNISRQFYILLSVNFLLDQPSYYALWVSKLTFSCFCINSWKSLKSKLWLWQMPNIKYIFHGFPTSCVSSWQWRHLEIFTSKQQHLELNILSGTEIFKTMELKWTVS